MKVVCATRHDLHLKPGGDGEHLRAALRALCALGVDARLVEAMAAPSSARAFDADLLHVHNLRRPADILTRLEASGRRGIPAVLTANWHSIERWLRQGREGLGALVARAAVSVAGYERWRHRALARRARISPDAAALMSRWGFHRCAAEVLARVQAVICASRWEAEALGAVFPQARGKTHVAPLGIAEDFAQARGDAFRDAAGLEGDFVLVTGRIEDLKNPRRILEACRGFPAHVVFIGEPNRAHPDYVARFSREVARHPSARWYWRLPRLLYVSAFAAARVHVHAAWTESLGLVSLEAARAGCSVVAPLLRFDPRREAGLPPGRSPHFGSPASLGDSPVREFLGDHARYVDPGDVSAIRHGLRAAWERGRRPAPSALSALTWPMHARALAVIYRRVVAGASQGAAGISGARA